MTSSEKVAIIAVVISLLALIISYLSFLRERRKANKDLLFQKKINAYKEIAFLGSKVYNDYFDIINMVQDYEDNPNHIRGWEEEFLRYSGTYYGKASEFKDLLSKYIVLLPNKIYNSIDSYSDHLFGFVTLSSHRDSKILSDSYDRLTDKFNDVVGLLREDINSDKLNISLSKQLK
ncbi:MAG: hypothetical protein MK076_08945 [Flavobacteriales bacterium]|nr:hypothetical protein [Flavobacteriales bacterium]